MKIRAISPVVATLILIIVAVVAGVAVYGFITGFIAQTTSQSQSPSSIVIDAAKIDTTNDNVILTVRNVGPETTTIIAVYILSSTDMSLVDNATITATQISSGGVAQITGTGVTNAQPDTWYIVKVVTSDGASATYKVKAS